MFLLPASDETIMKLWLKLVGIALAIVAGGYFLVPAQRALIGQNLSALFNPNVFITTAALSLLYAQAMSSGLPFGNGYLSRAHAG
jgi:hypothetical protein